jgi:hypothetical protein
MCIYTVKLFITNWKQRTNEHINKDKIYIEIINTEKEKKKIHVFFLNVCMNDRERQMRLCMYVEKEKKDVRTFLFVRI